MSRTVLGILIVGVLLFAACNRNPQSDSSPLDVARSFEGRAGANLMAVPAEPPGPYRLEAIDADDYVDGRLVRTVWHYRQTEESRETDGELPVIEVCVLRRSRLNLCNSPGQEPLAVRDLPGGRRVYITATGPGSIGVAASHWQDVKFTTNWQEETWLLE